MGSLVEDGGQALSGDAAILALAPGLIGGDLDNTVDGSLPETPQHVFFEWLWYRRRLSEIETHLGPGVRAVGVLTTGSPGGAEGP